MVFLLFATLLQRDFFSFHGSFGLCFNQSEFAPPDEFTCSTQHVMEMCKLYLHLQKTLVKIHHRVKNTEISNIPTLRSLSEVVGSQ